MTSNIRNRGPSGNALQRGWPADTLVGILLELVSLDVQEALVALLRPLLRRTELPMWLTTDGTEEGAKKAAAELEWTEHRLISDEGTSLSQAVWHV